METMKDHTASLSGGAVTNMTAAKPKKTYAPPCLVEWGTILELTRGSVPIGGEDPDFVSTSFGT